jgi:hypothetical protein
MYLNNITSQPEAYATNKPVNYTVFFRLHTGMYVCTMYVLLYVCIHSKNTNVCTQLVNNLRFHHQSSTADDFSTADFATPPNAEIRTRIRARTLWALLGSGLGRFWVLSGSIFSVWSGWTRLNLGDWRWDDQKRWYVLIWVVVFIHTCIYVHENRRIFRIQPW